MNAEKRGYFLGAVLRPTLITTSWFCLRYGIAHLQILPRPSALVRVPYKDGLSSDQFSIFNLPN